MGTSVEEHGTCLSLHGLCDRSVTPEWVDILCRGVNVLFLCSSEAAFGSGAPPVQPRRRGAEGLDGREGLGSGLGRTRPGLRLSPDSSQTARRSGGTTADRIIRRNIYAFMSKQNTDLS